MNFLKSIPYIRGDKNNISEYDDSRFILTLFFGSLLVRIFYVVFLNVNQIADGQDILMLTNDDQKAYWLFAEALLKDTSWMTEHVSYRPPLYPMFLALVTAIIGAGKNFINILLLQCVIGSFSVVIIYYISKNIFNRQTAVLSSLWASIYPLYLYYCGFILGETVVIFLFLLFTLFIVMYLNEYRHTMIICSGVIYALLIHVDPRFIFHLPFVLLYFYVGLIDLRKSVKAYIIFSLVVLLCSLPWAVRNHLVYKDRFVLINTRTLDKWAEKPIINIGKGAENRQISSGLVKPDNLEKFEELKRKSILLYMENNGTKKPDKDMPRFAKISSEEEIMAFESGIRPAFGIIPLYLHNFIEFWRFARFKPDYNPYPDLRFENTWALHRNLIGILFTGVLFPFLLVGIIFCIKYRNNYALILCLIILIHTFLHVIVHARERYRMPIEGFVAMLAFYGLLEIIAKYKINSRATIR